MFRVGTSGWRHKMIGFEYYNPAKIVFGEDSEQKLKDLLASYQVKSLLLVYSGDFIKSLGIYSGGVRDRGSSAESRHTFQ